MRKLLLVLAVLVFVVNVMAISTTVEPGKLGKSGSTYPVKKVTGNELRLNKGSVMIFDNQSAATLPGTKVGETIYNYQTNDNMHDRIVYDVATGKMHVQWMYGDVAEVPIFPNRHMYYNFYDGTAWKHQLGLPFENIRAGYGSLAATPSNAAVGASHHTTTGEEAAIVWYDFIEGFGFFSPSTVWATRTHGSILLEPFWPDIAVDGNNNWFVTTTNNNQDDFVLLVNDVNDNVIFWSSQNQGATWSDYYPMFPDTTTYPLGTGASGPSEAGSHQVETSDLNDGTVGVLVSNAGHDFYLFESKDSGETFGEAVWVIGNTFVEGTDDSLTYPARWDVIVSIDSASGVPVDTSLYIFTGDANTDTGEFEVEPNIRVSPHGPSDLFYLNGEPHVVWNELVHSGSNSYYPNGYGRWWTTPYTKYLSGDSTHLEAGFRIKHWSPSTGVSMIYKNDENTDVNPGTFQQYVTMPQVCADVDGNV
ncbi:hypothetical protein KAH55_04570, partial [bacterium]|nr:hypothetical protein [bacterium]